MLFFLSLSSFFFFKATLSTETEQQGGGKHVEAVSLPETPVVVVVGRDGGGEHVDEIQLQKFLQLTLFRYLMCC